jgi:acyl-coenzyme A synthetase/AMP-(fatty) acid ligase
LLTIYGERYLHCSIGGPLNTYIHVDPTQVHYRRVIPPKLLVVMASEILRLIFRERRLHNETLAIVDGSKSIHYADLLRAVCHLSQFLKASGIVPNQRVPILTTRSIEGILAIISVLAVGACYVPIDVESWSNDRIHSTFQVLNTETVLSTVNYSLPCFRIIQVGPVSHYIEHEDEKSHNSQLLSPTTTQEQLAYIIFTSGTTGLPKGVMISAGALLHYVQQEPFNLATRPGDTVQLIMSIGFDGELYLFQWTNLLTVVSMYRHHILNAM